MSSRGWSRPSRLGLLLGLMTLGSSSCGNRESPLGPLSPIGTYSLTRCGVGTNAVPLPCTVFVSPDSERVRGATFTIQTDSTWTSAWQEAVWVNGVWGADTVYTLSGWYAAAPGNDSSYAIWSGYPPFAIGSMVIVGNRLDYGTAWTFQR